MKKHFNKNLIITEEEEEVEQFELSNTCWICKKLIVNDDEKVETIVKSLVNLEVQFIGVATLILI